MYVYVYSSRQHIAIARMYSHMFCADFGSNTFSSLTGLGVNFGLARSTLVPPANYKNACDHITDIHTVVL